LIVNMASIAAPPPPRGGAETDLRGRNGVDNDAAMPDGGRKGR
jgi:hypothetical protein